MGRAKNVETRKTKKIRRVDQIKKGKEHFCSQTN